MIGGIHHVTAIATDSQKNLEFYAGLLGLRLVKQTVNFDDPGTYHFYFGDQLGRPGTILTFFPWPLARRGSRGVGQATTTSFSVPAGALGYWRGRLADAGVVMADSARRFGQELVRFFDADGLELELVAHEEAAGEPWGEGPIPAEVAIRGLHSVTLRQLEVDTTDRFLTQTLGLSLVSEEGPRRRYAMAGEGPGRWVDVVADPQGSHGRIAAGTVHHVAWRVASDDEQKTWREKLVAAGAHVSPIMDRQYFHSIYFHEPGGVVFEIATDRPGFTLDEEPRDLGRTLRLPPWLEARRGEIEPQLPAIELPAPGATRPDYGR